MTVWFLARKKIQANVLDTFHSRTKLNSACTRISILLLSFVALAVFRSELFYLIVETLSDVYLAVSVFVALTLGVFYLLDRRFSKSVDNLLKNYRFLHVPIASFLGALPGCGGAIIVVTQFTNGQISFGALVAVLISTMGDAAFLLLTQRPDVALLVYSVSLIAGIIFGYSVDWLDQGNDQKINKQTSNSVDTSTNPLPSILSTWFNILLVPGAVFGVAEAFQVDTAVWFQDWIHFDFPVWLGFFGAVNCLVIWMSQPMSSWSSRIAESTKSARVSETVAGETSFVTVWVSVGFLTFELLMFFTGLDIAAWFQGLGLFAIALAILIGFIPGCGPQIIVTTLFINGLIPLSAQLANAISNDGDALFPAIAMAPKAAFKATIYSAVPAVIIGYSTFCLGW